MPKTKRTTRLTRKELQLMEHLTAALMYSFLGESKSAHASVCHAINVILPPAPPTAAACRRADRAVRGALTRMRRAQP